MARGSGEQPACQRHNQQRGEALHEGAQGLQALALGERHFGELDDNPEVAVVSVRNHHGSRANGHGGKGVLVRGIQLYSLGGYSYCRGQSPEDGFCG